MRFPWFNKEPRLPLQPPRVYAVGDIHGCAELFEQLIENIRLDVAQRPPRTTRVIVLGDFVDRGPDSAVLIRVFMRLAQQPTFIVLKGNHEAVMVDALAGDHAALDLWLQHGGAATLNSFGLDVSALDPDDARATLRAAQAAVPRPVQAWLKRLPTHVQFGGYYYVHAGIKPGVPLTRQTDESRLWAGDEFTASDADHSTVVVHGHTIDERGPSIRRNRIGVDTGAYRTGVLSAVGIDGDEQWVVRAGANDQPAPRAQ